MLFENVDILYLDNLVFKYCFLCWKYYF